MLRYACVAFLSLAVLVLPREWFFKIGNDSNLVPPVRLLSIRELSQFDGEEGSKGLYLAMLGQVFDVHKGHKHYGLGGAYHFMAGKDASLAFVTGDFTESGLTDDVSSLSPLQVVALYDWLAFYQRDYQAVGVVAGRFYSETGKPTGALLEVEESLAEGLRIKAQSEAEKLRFPPCNSQWSAAGGGRVWCTTKSGGVERRWTGVPRKLFNPGSPEVRCVCVEDPSAEAKDPNLQKGTKERILTGGDAVDRKALDDWVSVKTCLPSDTGPLRHLQSFRNSLLSSSISICCCTTKL